MDNYIITSEFAAPQIGVRLYVSDTVGKIAARLSTLVGGVEYTSKAFYDWVGTEDSLNYLSFVGVIPDPISPTGPAVRGGIASITSGVSVVTVTGAAFGFVPSGVAVVVLKPNPGSNLFATVRVATITADGFTADLSSSAPASGYSLGYIVNQ